MSAGSPAQSVFPAPPSGIAAAGRATASSMVPPALIALVALVAALDLVGGRVGIRLDAKGATFLLLGGLALIGVTAMAGARLTRRLDDARRESEARFRTLTEAIPQHFWTADPDGTIDYVNPRMIEFFRVPPERLLGQAWRVTDVVHPEDLARMRVSWEETVARGEPAETEFRFRGRDGEYRWHLAKVVPIKDDEGAVVKWVGTSTDITALKSAEEALRENELRFREFAENIREIFWMTDVEMRRMIYVSPAYESIVGRDRETAYRDPRAWAENVNVHPEDLARVKAAFEKQMGRGYDEEYRILRPDGEIRWLRDRAFPVRDASGQVYRLAGIAEDVTAMKRAESALRESEARFRKVFEEGPVGMALLDQDLRIEKANAVLCGMLGYQATGLSGRALAGLAHPDEMESMGAIRRVFTGETESERSERRFLTRSGAVVWLNLAVTVVRDAAGRALYGLVIASDITARRAAERALHAQRDELERLARQLQAANRELEAFSYSVSHDLRAPLRGLEVYSGELMEEHAQRLGPAGGELVRRLRAETERMRQIIDDLLRLSRATRGDLHRERVDVAALAHDVVDGLRRADPTRVVDVVVEEPLLADADPNFLRVVLENLIGNAWKYTAKAASPRIEVGVRHEDGRPEFFVRDNGAGFAPQQASRLFRPFVRLHGDDFRGTGVGLTIVERIVARHGGHVRAESAGPGEGATFSFTL